MEEGEKEMEEGLEEMKRGGGGRERGEGGRGKGEPGEEEEGKEEGERRKGSFASERNVNRESETNLYLICDVSSPPGGLVENGQGEGTDPLWRRPPDPHSQSQKARQPEPGQPRSVG